MSLPIDRSELQVEFEEKIGKEYPDYFNFRRWPFLDPLTQYIDSDTRHAFVGFVLARKENS